MPKIHANGLNFHYQQAGEGPDVILIHGVTGDLSIWFLCQAMGVLARSFRVTAYDLRGHGYSDVPPSGYTSADQAGDALAIMDALEIDRAMLVGHSFGGVIAMHAAVLAPGPDRRGRALRPVLRRPCGTWKTWADGATGRTSARRRPRRASPSPRSTGTTWASSSTRCCTSTASGCSSSARPSASPASTACSGWPGRPAATTRRPRRA